MYDPCDGLEPKDGEELEIQLTLLGYGDYTYQTEEDGSVIPSGGEFVEDETRWTELVEALGTDGGVSPDFETEVVFVNEWIDSGCGDSAPTYGAWRWDESVRVRELDGGGKCTNDMSLPNADIGVLARGAATEFGWCE